MIRFQIISSVTIVYSVQYIDSITFSRSVDEGLKYLVLTPCDVDDPTVPYHRYLSFQLISKFKTFFSHICYPVDVDLRGRVLVQIFAG